MTEVTRIGLDTSKGSFQLHGVDAAEAVVLKRSQMLEFVKTQSACLVTLEACGASQDHSTAGRQRLGGITRAGDEPLRSVLVAGAMAVLRHHKPDSGGLKGWLTGLLARKSMKVAAVALANKPARIAWRLLVSGGSYDPAQA